MEYAFFAVCAVLVLGCLVAFFMRRNPWGFPVGAVLATTGVWYVGDAAYNDYEEYRRVFGDQSLTVAWIQVLAFSCVVIFLTPALTYLFLGGRHKESSFVDECLRSRRVETPEFQQQFVWVVRGILIAWTMLMAIALWKASFEFMPLFFPYLTGVRLDPWSRTRLGGGIDSLLAFGAYLQIFLTAALGVTAALVKNSKTRLIAFIGFLLSFPYFAFSAARSHMLAAGIPGFLAYVGIRNRAPIPVKIWLVIMAFMAVDFWFAFVLQNRGGAGGVDKAFASGVSFESVEDTKHLGLNMFEELAWVNFFQQTGVLEPNMGRNYWAEFVNPVPRALWKNKPLVGIEYSIARGQAYTSDATLVTATIAKGMVGQGILNFGYITGPLVAGALMAAWAAFLARQDVLAREQSGRLVVYGAGLILTFNLGRDITLMVMYPFFFGLIVVWAWEWWTRKNNLNVSGLGLPQKIESKRLWRYEE